MNTGFHYVPQKGLPNRVIRGHELDHATKIEPVGSTALWKLKETVPHSGNSHTSWFSDEDISHLTMRSLDDVKAIAETLRWRSRRHNTTKLRQLYLFDILATTWYYMRDWEGNTLDPRLLKEADDRAERLGVLL